MDLLVIMLTIAIVLELFVAAELDLPGFDEAADGLPALASQIGTGFNVCTAALAGNGLLGGTKRAAVWNCAAVADDVDAALIVVREGVFVNHLAQLGRNALERCIVVAHGGLVLDDDAVEIIWRVRECPRSV